MLHTNACSLVLLSMLKQLGCVTEVPKPKVVT